MSNFVIEIKAPELVEAIKLLANNLGVLNNSPVNVTPINQTPVEPTPVNPIPAGPATTTIPTAPAAPVATPAAPEAPAAIPTTPTSYTMEQLAVAATQLMDAGQKDKVVGLLQQFGVAALTQLREDRYGEFATALRQMGAKI